MFMSEWLQKKIIWSSGVSPCSYKSKNWVGSSQFIIQNAIYWIPAIWHKCLIHSTKKIYDPDWCIQSTKLTAQINSCLIPLSFSVIISVTSLCYENLLHDVHLLQDKHTCSECNHCFYFPLKKYYKQFLLPFGDRIFVMKYISTNTQRLIFFWLQ